MPHLLEIAVDPDVALATDFLKIGPARHSQDACLLSSVSSRSGARRGEMVCRLVLSRQHYIVEHNAPPLFADRFASMRWSDSGTGLLRALGWTRSFLHCRGGALGRAGGGRNGKSLCTHLRKYFQPGPRKSARDAGRDAEEILAEPAGKRRSSPSSVREAPQRVERETDDEKERGEKNEGRRVASRSETSSLTTLRGAAAGCTACPLYKNATQTVFGEGPKQATMMLLGEQPGDQEDLSGKPFIGPAGQLLDRALEEAGIDRDAVYVTNTVKHFNGSRAASVASTRNRIRATSPPAGPGWRRNSASLGQASARPRLDRGPSAFGSSFRSLKEAGEGPEIGVCAPGRDHGASFLAPPAA